MTQENHPFSDLDLLLSTDDITENDLLQLPELLLEESENSPIKTHLTKEPTNLCLTPTDKPTVALNDRAKQRKSIIPHDNSFRDRKGAKKLHLKKTSLKTHNFSLI